MSKSCLFFVASLFFFFFQAIGQSKNELDQLDILDSIAFAALENGLPNTEQKAENLLKTSEQYQSDLHVINAYTLLGILNKNKGYYITAVDLYNSALKVAEKSDDSGRISACYNNIGTVYQIQENYPKALFYFQKSLDIEAQLNNPLQKSIRLYNIGDMYREMDSLSLALTNFNSSLIIEKEYQNREGIVYALLGLSDIYLKLERPTDASISLNEVKNYINDSDVEIQILFNILSADLLCTDSKFDQALKKLREAKAISNKYDFRVHLVDIYEKEIETKEAQEAFEFSSKNDANAKTPAETNNTFLIIILALGLIAVIAIILFYRRKKGKVTMPAGSTQENTTEIPIFQLESEAGKVLLKVAMHQIISFEANDNYVITHYLSDDGELQKSMERASLKKIEEILAGASNFHRVHKSHIINQKHVISVDGKSQAYKIKLALLETSIPVSRSFDIGQLSQ